MFTTGRAIARRQARWALILSVLVSGSTPAFAQSPPGIGMQESPLAGSGLVVREEQWARTLARALSLDHVLPDEPDPSELFALLCADAAEMATDAEGRRAPARAAFRTSAEMLEGRAPGEPVRIVLDVPATALYELSVEGTGKQRWTVDQRAVGHLDPSHLGIAIGPRIVPLRAGPHELAGYVGREARIDRVELSAYRPLCIAPGGGWNAGRPLTAGGQARTLVRALGLDRFLPETRVAVDVEGEHFTDSTRWGGRSNAGPDEPLDAPTRGRTEWARAGDSPAEFSYRMKLESPGVFSLIARVSTGASQIWSIDGRYRARVDGPIADQSFDWVHVMTTSLTAGDHVVRALVPPGSGIDRIRLVKRQSLDADYVEILEQMGFHVGGTNALVTRGSAFAALSHPVFQELSDGFLERVAGNAAEPPLVALDDRIAPLFTRPLAPVLPAEL